MAARPRANGATLRDLHDTCMDSGHSPSPVGRADCDVPRLDVLNIASLCPAVSIVDLFYLLTVVMNFVGWFIFRHRLH